jgi:hypothetical protein
MKKISLILVLFFLANALSAQSVLLHKDVNDTIVVEKFGPNLKRFGHFYFGAGFIFGKPDSVGSETVAGLSMNYMLGFRYKIKLTNWFALGGDLALSTYSFRVKQDSSKAIPNNIIHDKEKISLGDLGANAFLRFNFGKRGNRIGNFLDLGGYADLTISGRHYYKDKMDNKNVIETTISHLNYLNAYNYGAMARIGFNRYVIYGSYRLSDIFEGSYKYPELPRITIGLQIGIHK